MANENFGTLVTESGGENIIIPARWQPQHWEDFLLQEL